MLACLTKPFGEPHKQLLFKGQHFLQNSPMAGRKGEKQLLPRARLLSASSGSFFSEGALSNFPWSSVTGFHNAGGRK